MYTVCKVGLHIDNVPLVNIEGSGGQNERRFLIGKQASINREFHKLSLPAIGNQYSLLIRTQIDALWIGIFTRAFAYLSDKPDELTGSIEEHDLTWLAVKQYYVFLSNGPRRGRNQAFRPGFELDILD